MIVDHPRDADIILYVEDGYIGLSKLPEVIGVILAAPKARHLLFSESDWPYPILPGAFPSLARAVAWADSWAYLIQLPLTAKLREQPSLSVPRYLFSFLGRTSTHAIRTKILHLDSPSTPCLDLSTAPERLPNFDRSQSYIDLIRNSHFVLCPRGFGASSIRIFETMYLGRVPVIIGDAWKAPPNADWDRFAVRVAEDEIDTIPDKLASLRDRAPEMGALAAEVFQRVYAPDVFLDELVSFLSAKHAREPAAISRLIVRAMAAAGWREFKTMAHQILHRRA